MWNMKSICDALGTRYAAVTPPSGERALRTAAQYPKSVPQTPFLVVAPQQGNADAPTNEWRITHQIDAEFFLAKRPADPARVETQRQKWIQPLWDQLDGQTSLGLSPDVKSAFPISYEWVELVYSGETYDGIRIHLQVITVQYPVFTP